MSNSVNFEKYINALNILDDDLKYYEDYNDEETTLSIIGHHLPENKDVWTEYDHSYAQSIEYRQYAHRIAGYSFCSNLGDILAYEAYDDDFFDMITNVK